MSGCAVTSFNPCFGGLVGQVPEAQKGWLGWRTVSILVLVDWSVRSGMSGARIPDRTRFNPCFGGLVGQVVSWVGIGRCWGWFQSLFWWIGRSGNPAGITGIVVFPFQSLFWWIGRSGRILCTRDLQVSMFQSLFWWIGRSGHVSRHRRSLEKVVSILVLVDWSVRCPQHHQYPAA